MNPKVSIRHLLKSDAELLAKYINNKKIWDNLRDYIPHPYSLEDAQNHIDSTQVKDPKTDFAILFENEFAGLVGFNMQTDVYRHSAEIGYWLGEPFWGKGITSSAVKLVVDHAFNVTEVKRLYTSVFDFNKASCKVLEKVGFIAEGVGKKSVIKNGVYLDEIRYGLLNPKFFPST